MSDKWTFKEKHSLTGGVVVEKLTTMVIVPKNWYDTHKALTPYKGNVVQVLVCYPEYAVCAIYKEDGRQNNPKRFLVSEGYAVPYSAFDKGF